MLIFLVVFGHMISTFADTPEVDVIYKIIFSFHMPAFIFVSGYFAKVEPKKILSRIFPLYYRISITSFFTGFHSGQYHVGTSGKIDMQFFTPRWTLWYLMAMIIYQLLLPVFDTKNKRHRVAYLLLSMVLGIVIGYNPDTENFMAMSRIMNFLPFFLAGYYEKRWWILPSLWKAEKSERSKIATIFLAVGIIAGFILVSRVSTRKLFWGTESFNGGVYTWYTRILAWIIAFLWIWILIVWVPTKRIQ